MTDAILAKMPGHKLDRFVFSFAPRSSPSLRRLLIYGVAARQCAKNRLPPVAAGRIQRNRAGVSWHTTLLAKSSVLYLCEGEGSRSKLCISCSGDETHQNERLADGANCTRLPAFRPLRSKGIQSPAAAARSYCIKIVVYPASHVGLCHGCYTLPSCRFAAIGVFPRPSVFHN